MNILEFLLYSFHALLILALLPLAALCDIIAFIAFLATFKAKPGTHKAAEKSFIVSSCILTAAAAAEGILYLIFSFLGVW